MSNGIQSNNLIEHDQIRDFFDDENGPSSTVNWSAERKNRFTVDAIAVHNAGRHPDQNTRFENIKAMFAARKKPTINQVSVSGARLITRNSTNTYYITDFDSFDTFAVSFVAATPADAGQLSYTWDQKTDKVILSVVNVTEGSTISMNVTRNGKVYVFDIGIGASSIATPSIINITDDSNTGLQPTIVASAFQTIGMTDTQTYAQFQIATDQAFTSIVTDTGYNLFGSVTQWKISPAIAYNTQYYVRVRYKSTNLAWSNWSQPATLKVLSGVGSTTYTVAGSTSKVIGRGGAQSTGSIYTPGTPGVPGQGSAKYPSGLPPFSNGTWSGVAYPSGSAPANWNDSINFSAQTSMYPSQPYGDEYGNIFYQAPLNGWLYELDNAYTVVVSNFQYSAYSAWGYQVFPNWALGPGIPGPSSHAITFVGSTIIGWSNGPIHQNYSGTAYLVGLQGIVDYPSGLPPYIAAIPEIPATTTYYTIPSNSASISGQYTATFSGNSSQSYPVEVASTLLDTSSNKLFTITAPADTFVLVFSV